MFLPETKVGFASWSARCGLMFLILTCSGCALLGGIVCPHQEHGRVTTINAELAPNQVVSHMVSLGDFGEFSHFTTVEWEGRRSRGGPQLRFFATRSTCTDFTPPPPGTPRVLGATLSTVAIPPRNADGTVPACEVLVSTDSEWHKLHVGRGPPPQDFGPPFIGYWPGKSRVDRIHAYPPTTYKIWAVGDSVRRVKYRIDVTWTYGPDC